MEEHTLAEILGLAAGHPRVEQTLRDFGVARRPELGIDLADADGPVVRSQDWCSNLSAGVEFGFQEEGDFMGLDHADRGAGPMLLTEVYFYGARPGSKPFPGGLPFGLQLSDSRAQVRATMAKHCGGLRSYVRDTWDRPAFRMTIGYSDAEDRIDFIVCMLRTEEPEPFEGATATMPSLQTLVALLGRPISDAMLRRTFVPLGLDRLVFTGKEDGVLDFRRTYGFKLTFQRSATASPARGGAARVLHSIELLRAGELESRGWRGGLPFGVRFDDSPDAVFDRIGVPPVRRSDQDFSGEAFWELDDHALLVTYSTMDNIVLRVSISQREL